MSRPGNFRNGRNNYDLVCLLLVIVLPGEGAWGEGGNASAYALLINIKIYGLSEYDVKHVDLLATPQREWRAIQPAKGVTKILLTSPPRRPLRIIGRYRTHFRQRQGTAPDGRLPAPCPGAPWAVWQ